MAIEFELRPERPEDTEFLYQLFAATHGAAFAAMPPLARMQFDAQRSHYRNRYPSGDFDVIVAGGNRVGRLCVDRAPGRAHIVDIAILPSWQGRGLGTAVIRRLQRERPVISLSVQPGNPARRLYEHLGFKAQPGEGPFVGMEWRSAARD